MLTLSLGDLMSKVIGVRLEDIDYLRFTKFCEMEKCTPADKLRPVILDLCKDISFEIKKKEEPK